MCPIPELITRKVARKLHTKSSYRNNFGNRVYRRVRFRSCETVGYGPTMWFFFLIGAVTSCTVMIARHVREYHVSYVGNNIGTKGEGRREPFSCSLKRGGPIGKFSSIGGYRNVTNNSNRVLLAELYTEVFT